MSICGCERWAVKVMTWGVSSKKILAQGEKMKIDVICQKER